MVWFWHYGFCLSQRTIDKIKPSGKTWWHLIYQLRHSTQTSHFCLETYRDRLNKATSSVSSWYTKFKFTLLFSRLEIVVSRFVIVLSDAAIFSDNFDIHDFLSNNSSLKSIDPFSTLFIASWSVLIASRSVLAFRVFKYAFDLSAVLNCWIINEFIRLY